MGKESKKALNNTIFLLFIVQVFGVPLFAQQLKSNSHTISSQFLNQDRELWLSLPNDYDKNRSYSVMYVLDAEYHFSLVSNIIANLARSKKTPQLIVVGIPHISIKKERIFDFTYSLSGVNPYGDKILPPFFSKRNCGGADSFAMFLTKELVPYINSMFNTNNKNVLIAHSLAGYFATGLLVKEHPFYAIQLYDPSNWYSNGEAGEKVKNGLINSNLKHLYLAHQKSPDFFYNKLVELDSVLETKDIESYNRVCFEDENHGSVFLPAFLNGMEHLYKEFKEQHFILKKDSPYKK